MIFKKFSASGDILAIRLKKKTLNSNEATIKAIIQYKSIDSVEKAIKEFDNKKFYDTVNTSKRMLVSKKKKHEDLGKIFKNNIFFKGLPENADLDKFRRLLSPYGEVFSLRVQESENKFRGSGYICMETAEGMAKLLSA